MTIELKRIYPFKSNKITSEFKPKLLLDKTFKLNFFSILFYKIK